ncbi:MAG: arsenic resistance protein [Planctomycetes bacterium]|nr:arsenic resistance protein [Planctomycetota bacterium]
MNRATAERRQVWIYVGAILAGLATHVLWPGLAPGAAACLWPVLGVLLYATLVQVPLLHVRQAFVDLRFLVAISLGNFVLVPLCVWAVLSWLPVDPALRLGVALVLLVPCTDWFLTFTHLGGGDTARAIAVAPLLLAAQVLLLPVYLGWMLPGPSAELAEQAGAILPSATLLLGVPLVLAFATERWIEAAPRRAPWRVRLGAACIPSLTLVVFLIALSQAGVVREARGVLLGVTPLFAGYLVVAALLARGLATACGLDAARGRALAYSLGTRNSFVVLPLALSLPAGFEVAVVVVVYQSVVELCGMALYLAILGKLVFPEARVR